MIELSIMSYESLNSDLDKQEFLFLSEKDQQVLKEGGRKVVELLLKDFTDELPKAIIFPDTSARPLAHMFLPILRKLSEERGQEIPSFYFFQQVHGDPSNIERAEEILDYEGRGSKLEEFLKKFLFKDGGGIAIIDDYVSAEANTIGKIRHAFGDKNIPAYAVMGEVNFFPDFAKINVGLLDPYASRPGRLSKGFDYRESNAIGVSKDSNSIYVSKNESVGEDVTKLRSDMKKVGEEIASGL